MVLRRTWPYGSKLKGTVISVVAGTKPTYPLMTTVEVGQGEAHIMVGVEHDIAPVQGLKVEVQFVQGGPLGAYWKITGTATENA